MPNDNQKPMPPCILVKPSLNVFVVVVDADVDVVVVVVDVDVDEHNLITLN